MDHSYKKYTTGVYIAQEAQAGPECVDKKSQLMLWEYMCQHWIYRNKCVHGDVEVSNKWIQKIQEDALEIKMRKPEVGHSMQGFLEIYLQGMNYRDIKRWIKRVK